MDRITSRTTTYDGNLTAKQIPLDHPLHRLEVVNRGSWGEVRFSCKDA